MLLYCIYGPGPVTIRFSSLGDHELYHLYSKSGFEMSAAIAAMR